MLLTILGNRFAISLTLLIMSNSITILMAYHLCLRVVFVILVSSFQLVWCLSCIFVSVLCWFSLFLLMFSFLIFFGCLFLLQCGLLCFPVSCLLVSRRPDFQYLFPVICFLLSVSCCLLSVSVFVSRFFFVVCFDLCSWGQEPIERAMSRMCLEWYWFN